MTSRPFLRVALCMMAFLGLPAALASAEELPRLDHQDGRYTLVVDGKPFFLLGAQVGNSSGWPERLEQLWPLASAMHVNTLEVPVYWEQLEPQQGRFDDSAVDQVVAQARMHHVRLVLLWFGTWKNGKMHYVPGWVKQDQRAFHACLPQRVNRSTCSARTPRSILMPIAAPFATSCTI